MKTKNLLALLFALVFMFISAVPSFASDGELPPVPGQEDTEPVPPPEEAPEPEDPPVLPDDPAEPGDETPEESEDPEDPPEEDEGEGPGDEEPSDEEPSDEEPSDEEPSDEEDPDEDGSDEEDEADGEAEEEEEAELLIDVLVPATGQVVVNPYHMRVATSTGEVVDQIVHEPQMLESLTECPLQVSVQVLGSLQPWSDAWFVSAPPADDAEDKEIFMYVEFQTDPDWWSYTYGDWYNQVLVTDWWEEKEDVMTLDAYGVGYFRLFGAMTPYPADMWTADDVMTVTLVFTFTPADEGAFFAAEIPEEPLDAVSGEFPEGGVDDSQVEFPEVSGPSESPESPPDADLEPVPGEILEPPSEEIPEPESDAV